jgi:hypothetical protein
MSCWTAVTPNTPLIRHSRLDLGSIVFKGHTEPCGSITATWTLRHIIMTYLKKADLTFQKGAGIM